MNNDAILYWLWLSSAVSMRQRTRAALLDYFGNPKEIYAAGYRHYSRAEGVYQKDAELLNSKTLQDAERILTQCDNLGIEAICPEDENYPERLKCVYSPPAVLYVKGKMPYIDSQPVISVIGTRKASPYGIKMGRKIAFEIGSCGGTVISLLTAGIDASAAEGVLLSGGKCIAVLGTSHDRHKGSFDDDIAANGAILSEYPPYTPSSRTFFRERNRIAAGLSLAVVVVEAPVKSGTAYFVNDALEQGKDVFAVPGNADSANSEGTINLLKLGARPATSGWDVLSEYESLFPGIIHSSDTVPNFANAYSSGVTDRQDKKRDIDKGEASTYIDWTEKLEGLSEPQKSIVYAVRDGASCTDEIIISTGMSASAVLAQMTVLEIMGILGRDAARRIIVK